MKKDHCKHCGLIVKKDEEFCCKGCSLAYKIINNFGFKNYYQQRILNDKEQSLKPELQDFVDINEFAISKNSNQHFVNLAISGLQCAACVWLIENILKKQENVISARVNLTKKRLYLEWQGDVDYGNELVKLIFNIGYKLLPLDENFVKEEEKKYNNDLLKALAIAGFGTGNIMLFSVILWVSTPQNMGIYTRDLIHFLSAIIAFPVIIYSGRIFFYSAFNALKFGRVNMDVPISLGIILAAIVSLIKTFQSAWHVYFDSAVMLVFFLLIGRFLDHQVRKKAFNIAAEFSLLNSGFARIEFGKTTKTIPLKKVEAGMILVIAAGEKIAADGVIIEGNSEIDNSLISGESTPKIHKKGDEVFGGTLNLLAPIKVKVTKIGEESLLGKIIFLMENAQNNKNHYARISDKLAKIYTPLVHILAAATFILWYFIFKGGADVAITNAVAVLIITCPCALALAIPIVQTIVHSSLMKKSILIKSGEALEKLDSIKTIIFDKTGSITKGAPKLVEIALIEDGRKNILRGEEKIFYLKIAASLAAQSNHPISKTIFNSYKKDLFDLQVKEKSGFGLESSFENKLVKLGRKEFCEIDFKENSQSIQLKCFMKFGTEELIFSFDDEIKNDAKSVISSLQKLGKNIILLSGDTKSAVENTAKKLAIKEFYFEKTPIEKVKIIEEKKSQGTVLKVGDGINDAPAISMADVSMSFCHASNITQNAADILIQGDKLQPVLTTLNFGKKSLRLMKENLFLALLYNAVAVPFAVMGFVTPLVAAFAMSSSSLLVLFNSLRARKS